MRGSENCSTLSDRQQDRYWSIVSDLVSLIERTRTERQTSDPAKQIEGVKDTSVGVLDDGAFPKTTANGAWSECNQRLREALYFLLEARPAFTSAHCSKASKQVAA
jgi:hypothetical protein